MINKLIELKLIKKQLIVLTVTSQKLNPAGKLYDDFSGVIRGLLLDLIKRALQLLDIKITADTSDDLINQVVSILTDYALAKFMFDNSSIDYLEIAKKLEENLTDILTNSRDIAERAID